MSPGDGVEYLKMFHAGFKNKTKKEVGYTSVVSVLPPVYPAFKYADVWLTCESSNGSNSTSSIVCFEYEMYCFVSSIYFFFISIFSIPCGISPWEFACFLSSGQKYLSVLLSKTVRRSSLWGSWMTFNLGLPGSDLTANTFLSSDQTSNAEVFCLTGNHTTHVNKPVLKHVPLLQVSLTGVSQMSLKVHYAK